MNLFFRRSLIGMSALTLSYSLPAAAVDFCVATGAQLNTALLTAATNGTNDVIKIQSGILIGPSITSLGWTYRPILSDSGATLRITGGFANGCGTTNPVGTADATQLDAQNLGPIFQLDTDGGFNYNGNQIPFIDAFTGQVILENLTMARGASFGGFPVVSFYAINLVSSGKLTLRNTFTTSSNSNAATVQVTASPAGNVLVQNNVVSNSNGQAGMLVGATDNAFANVSNNSIFNNTGDGIAEGLYIFGTVNLFNNAVADNTSSQANSREVICETQCLSVSLRNNHFQTFRYSGSGVFSDIGTTTNNPEWTAVGSVRVPKAVSPLRDSGNNTPSGGLLPTDILGNPRLVNGTVDRGAVEAAVVPNTSPTVNPVSPTPSTSTNLGTAPAGQSVQGQITFLVTGGNGVAITSVACSVLEGPTLSVLANGYQTVAPGGSLLPVSVGYGPLVSGLQQGSIQCLVTPQGAPTYTFTYAFFATGSADALFANGFEQ